MPVTEHIPQPSQGRQWKTEVLLVGGIKDIIEGWQSNPKLRRGAPKTKEPKRGLVPKSQNKFCPNP